MSTYPLIRHEQPDSIIAYQNGKAISAAQYLSDVAALADLLPSRQYIINLCRDRYRFAVGLGAALARGQISLLPPNEVPALLDQLAADYPDLYRLDDSDVAMEPPIPQVRYPQFLPKLSMPAAIPAFAAEQIAVLLFTSGSTNRPQPHAKSWGALMQSTWAAGERLGIAALSNLMAPAKATVLGTVPHQHSYGLESTILLPLQHGLALHAERPLFPADICRMLDDASCPRILVTTPIHLRSLLAEHSALPRVDLILCATAPLSPQTAAAAETHFAAPLQEIYGCSEAGQIAARRTVETAEWRCFRSMTLRQDRQGTWVQAEDGTDTLLQDVIELHGPDRFLLHGRTADMINIAGKRSSIAHLNYHLNSIPGVEDGVFVMPDADLKDKEYARMMAFVVAPGLQSEDILGVLRKNIDAAFLPRPLCMVDALPRNDLGKLPREAIMRLAREALDI